MFTVIILVESMVGEKASPALLSMDGFSSEEDADHFGQKISAQLRSGDKHGRTSVRHAVGEKK